ncbi:glycosyltransferase [Glaesserella parasuis]|nr:glycosyltransferase [Glaesserella parasuis]MCT8837584.1 glycosyltransferase [Glaesserella parasuis]
MANISVLLSVYAQESAVFLEQAIYSIFNKQTLKPTEIILVQDGPLTLELKNVIDNQKKLLGDVLKVVALDQNRGLANALNVGISYCSGDFIARMDTDDISTENRFLEQFTFLVNNPDIDVVGCWISEIDEHNNIIKAKVEYPLEHNELYSFFEKRDPLAHPSVMFRRSFFDKVKGYSNTIPLAEDTHLWYDGFRAGCQFANISYIGLQFRRNSAFYKRRSNLEKSIKLLKFRLFYINRHLNYGVKADLYAVAYFCLSFMPSIVKKFLYRFLR